jgi:hypothetical protein
LIQRMRLTGNVIVRLLLLCGQLRGQKPNPVNLHQEKIEIHQ